MSRAHATANVLDFRRLSWRSYNLIRKKAMEQEFSMSGLAVSLSIAFFVVIICAQLLNLLYQSVLENDQEPQEIQKVYRLEDKKLINSETKLKIIGIKRAEAAELKIKGETEKNTDHLESEMGAQFSYKVSIKNTGEQIWEKDKVFLETGPFLRSFSKFTHPDWKKYYRSSGLEKNVKPGETASITFYLKAPNEEGTLQENFQLVKDNQPITGTNLRLFINVKKAKKVLTAANIPTKAPNDKPILSKSDFCIALAQERIEDYEQCQTAPKENDTTNGQNQTANLAKEPIIRVGLYNTKTAQRITLNEYFDVYGGTQTLLSGLASNSTVVAGYDFLTKKYYVSTFNVTKYSTEPIRFIPRNKSAISTLLDFNNNPRWNASLNDNQFRNIIELQISKAGDLWIINELPIEDYLKGLGETSNYSPVEYQKVMITAARTYAMYHYNRGLEYNVKDGSTKHANEHFHIDATYDQVYRGYASEKRMPKLAQASNETRGQVVTYDKKVVVTPYFSRSDGRTRNWEEVWGGQSKAWLVSVSVPEDSGETLWGHGVGMSARGALLMATNQNKNWQDILKYFYQGIEISKIYN